MTRIYYSDAAAQHNLFLSFALCTQKPMLTSAVIIMWNCTAICMFIELSLVQVRTLTPIPFRDFFFVSSFSCAFAMRWYIQRGNGRSYRWILHITRLVRNVTLCGKSWVVCCSHQFMTNIRRLVSTHIMCIRRRVRHFCNQFSTLACGIFKYLLPQILWNIYMYIHLLTHFT